VDEGAALFYPQSPRRAPEEKRIAAASIPLRG
jgi:hypothetical protein